MIADDDRNGFGSDRLHKAPPDPAPRHPGGKNSRQGFCTFVCQDFAIRLPELWEIQFPLTRSASNLRAIAHERDVRRRQNA